MGADDPEAVPLVKRAERHDRWFDAPMPRDSLPPGESMPPPPPFRPSAARAVVAGLASGGVAGLALVLVASLVARATKANVTVARTIGAWTFGSRVPENAHTWAGAGAVAAFGAVTFVLLSLATRHVRRGLPMFLFGLLFAPVMWLALDVFLLRRFAPALAASLPFGAMAAGAASFGACLALVPAFRDRS